MLLSSAVITLSLVEVQSIVKHFCLSMSVCLSVCLHIKNHTSRFSVHVMCGHCHGLLLLSWLCNTLCALSFVDDIIFSHNITNGQNERWCICLVMFIRWRHQVEVCRLRLLIFNLMFNLWHRCKWTAATGLPTTTAVSSSWCPVCAGHFHWHATWTANIVLFLWSVYCINSVQ